MGWSSTAANTEPDLTSAPFALFPHVQKENSLPSMERHQLGMRTPFLFPLVMTVLAGCGKTGPDVAPVSGRVTLDGRPIEFVDVTFQAEGKSPGVGRTDKDGHYALMYKRGVVGTPIGPNRVTLMVNTERTHGPQNIPVRYNTESDLSREVQAGEDNVFDFDLKSDAKAK